MPLFLLDAHPAPPFGDTLSAASEMTSPVILESPPTNLLASADSRMPLLLDTKL